MGPAPAPVAPAARGSLIPVVGGILIIISGIIGIVIGLTLAVAASAISEMFADLYGGMYGIDVLGMFEGILVACGVIWFIIGLIAFIGGVFGLRKKRWGLAIVGGVFALLTIGPYFIGSILGLIGLILVAISKREFS